jgi:SAM-dependent methyltransferase
LTGDPPTRRREPGSRLDLGRRAVTRFVERAAAAVPPGARVLDCGAGEGWYRRFFGGRRYAAVDLALGDARWDYGGLDVLAEAARVLRPGGILLLTAPQGFREHQAPHDYWRFTRYSLRMLAEEAGFAEVEVEVLGGYFAFMGDRLPAFHRYLFPRRRALALRVLLLPLALVSKVLFAWIAPRACALLDPLDDKRTYANGYGLRARRGGAA